ncbi:hypothetical protein OGH69_02390 [Flavobacterium sp. MFBS3-15]|uniref:hypothetical protein n=1 Tax=Flavobacterium sp. MFBS3-15 TaxID=2989816 RepID=UPI0022360080|nr:hypothetical protein [Flavobacterium sp. MFBS3-15]MCW4467799.1 hypothetical protein [Flavobacterium sp. MFBS3-15]
MHTISSLYAHVPFPLLIVILAVGGILHLHKKYRDRQQRAKDDAYRNRVVSSGKKIAIPTSYINSRSVPASKSMRKQAHNYLYDRANVEKYVVTETTWLECSHKGKKFKSNGFSIDRKVLEIKLYMQKEVYIYYDNATGDYFFDLDFLEEA